MAITINEKNRSIVLMGKEFAKAASQFGTPEYADLQAARRDYPNYAIVARTIRRNSDKKTYHGLTYTYNNVMKRHMAGIRRATNGKSAYENYAEVCDEIREFMAEIQKEQEDREYKAYIDKHFEKLGKTIEKSIEKSFKL